MYAHYPLWGRMGLWIAVGFFVLMALLSPSRVQAQGPTIVCADFDALPLGTQYRTGDTFASNGIQFRIAGGDGFVQVHGDQAAGGTGRDLEVNNANLQIDFAAMPNVAPVDGIVFRFGEYDGHLRLHVNGGEALAVDPELLDGLMVGGAAISVNKSSPTRGALAVVGVINSSGVDGEQLWIDDLCIRKGQMEEPEPGVRPDLGDAPDSSNRLGMQNTAYPGVLGRFPTVWHNTPAGVGTGPKHRNATPQAWLGNSITPEVDADPNAPDGDGLNNILAGGADNANNDRFDDGWRNRFVPFPPCAPTTLVVRVSRAAASNVPVMYLNVWIDGNGDGDWADIGSCSGGSPWEWDPADVVTEWIVANRAIPLNAIPAGGFADLPITTAKIYGAPDVRASWLRFTLSETPVAPLALGLPSDGRAPDYPFAYAYGETEDYLRRRPNPGEPGTVEIQKTQQGTESGSVQAGDTFTYTVRLRHVGGDGPALVTMSDTLPSGVVAAGPVKVTEEAPQAAPLAAGLRNGVVRWNGALSPDALIRLEIPVRAVRCLGQPLEVTNTASARQMGGSRIEASVRTRIVCGPGNPPVVVKRILEEQNGSLVEVVQSDIVPGATATYRFKVSNPTNRTAVIHLRDPLPEGLLSGPPRAPTSVIERTVVVPAGGQKDVDVAVWLARRAEGEQELVNVARYVSCFGASGDVVCSFPVENDPLIQPTNAVTLTVKGRDLGDAPDSTNHFAVPMAAYAGVPANFPTVFDPAVLPVGPAHIQPQLFHLGLRVSREANADIGPDADAVNNINPPVNLANRDRRDDGVNVGAIPFADCRRFEFDVRVTIAPAALALLQNGTGYLNAWVDGTRDGDWADFRECPQPNAPANAHAFEHFVIDFPIDAAALGVGVHTVTVQSTHPVFWPQAAADQPAWVRLTLSDRPSNKTLTAGAVNFGDGRGPLPPFRLGETEDFVWRPGQAANADLVLRKRGVVAPVVGEGGVKYVVRWLIDYRNVGDAAYMEYVLKDVLVSGVVAGSLRLHTYPPLSVEITGNELTFPVGTLEPGAGGRILITAEVPESSLGQPQVNRARATGQGDINLENNEVEATARGILPAPRIEAPRSGTTNKNEVAIEGWSVPGSEVTLYVDDMAAGVVTADANGRWAYGVELPAGDHSIGARAKRGLLESPLSTSVEITVDPTLPFDPVSMHLKDGSSNTIALKGSGGRLDAEGWTLLLPYIEQENAAAAGATFTPPYTLTFDVRNGVGSVSLMEQEGIFYFCGAGNNGGNNIIAILIGLVCVHEQGSTPVVLTVNGPRGSGVYHGAIRALPRHIVRDAETGDPIGGATVNFGWDIQQPVDVAAAHAAGANGLLDPIVTDNRGQFSWGMSNANDAVIRIEAPGYQPLFVAAGYVHNESPLEFLLLPEADDEVLVELVMTEEGFDPPLRTIQPGRRVRLTNLDVWEHAFVVDGPYSAQAAGVDGAPAGETAPALLAPGASIVLPAGARAVSDAGNPDATAAIVETEPAAVEIEVFLPVVNRQ